MPRIDPAQLLKTLSVLLGPHGGIKSEDEVSRLVTLMEKFSKKLVSKVVYIKILLATNPEILDKFLGERGWDLLNFWFAEGIRSSNWPLCNQIIQLFLLSPMTAERLRENSDQNRAPKLVRQLTYDSRVDDTLRDLSNQVLTKWMTVISPSTSVPNATMIVPAAPLRTRNRGQRGQSVTPQPMEVDKNKQSVTVFTETDEITNLSNLSCHQCVQQETQYWMGKCGKTLRMQARKAKAAAKPKVPKLKLKLPPPPTDPAASTADPEIILDPKDKDFKIEEEAGEEEEDDDDDDDDDDDISMLMKRANNALNRRYRGSEPEIRKVEILEKKAPNSPLKNEVSEMSTGDMNGVVKDEVMDVDDLLKDDEEEESKPLLILQGMAEELAETLLKEKELEKTKEKEKQKDKENKKDKNREKDRDKDKNRDKDRDRSKHRSKEDDRRRKEKEERRRKEKERERQKEKERMERKRESKPFKESELRNGLDSKEREKIKMVAQRMKDESLIKKDVKPSTISSMAKIPKIPKKEEVKEDKSKKSGSLSFEDLMGAMDAGKASKSTIKAPPIKNKNKDLLASFSSPPITGKSKAELPKPQTKPSDYLKNGYVKNMQTEDKTSKIIPASQFLSLEKKAEKRPVEPEVPKIKIKSPSQLKESPMFGDFLSTIMKEDQPKKKKIKIAELKAKTLEEEEREKEKKEREMAEAKAKEEEVAVPVLSFYRDTMDEGEPCPPGEEEPRPLSPSDGVDDFQMKSASPGSSPGGIRDQDLVVEDPKDVGPRDVRGILVYARGAIRTKKRIVWREDSDLVQVEYFELDETERVNVNKVKFEERRKMESEFEKSSMHQKSQVAAEESRPWPTPLIFDFQSPDVEYGSSSVEKVTQAQRENSVLQALYFNNKLPNDPSEPENATTIRFETKDIPLIDESGEETFMDYSDLGWPLPAPEYYARVPGAASISPQTDAIFANIHQNLNNMMGGGGVNMDSGNNRIETAMLAAQMAAEESIRKGGHLPPNHVGRFNGHDQHPAHPMDQAYEPGDEPYEPMDAEYGMGFPPTGMLGGPPPPFPPPFNGPLGPPSGPPPTQPWNQNTQHNNFRGNNNRGFYRGNRGDGTFRGKERRGSDRKNDFGGGRRPCKYFSDKGFCRDGDRCKFIHQRR